MKNAWCGSLNMDVPNLEAVKDHREANSFTLLLVALLEKGEPMTLPQVADRFEEVGIAPSIKALESLKKCRPGRPPLYRTDDHYGVDTQDQLAGLWVFRLGLRPARVAPLRVIRNQGPSIPDMQTPLTIAELDEAWKDAVLNSWSAKRLVLPVLEAYGRAMSIQDIIAFLDERVHSHVLDDGLVKFKSKTSVIQIRPDGLLASYPQAAEQMPAIRKVLRDRIKKARDAKAKRPDMALIKARSKQWQRKDAATLAKSSQLSRVILYAFPEKSPEALVLLDVRQHRIDTFFADDFEDAVARLAAFDIIAGMGIRGVLAGLVFNPEGKTLIDLGPPQKTKQISKSRKLKITTELLIQGSCGISRALGDKKKMTTYLESGQHTKLRRRLEANAKSLFALFQFGRLHGALRLRWGFLDERLPVSWGNEGIAELHVLSDMAAESGRMLEVVKDHAPGWESPWERAELIQVVKDGWRKDYIDQNHCVMEPMEIQQARIVDKD